MVDKNKESDNDNCGTLILRLVFKDRSSVLLMQMMH